MKNPKLKTIEESIHAALNPIGFKRQRRTWRKHLPDIMQVVHLDKSTWGPQYHLMFGLQLAKFSNDPQPLFADHVRWGPEQFPQEVLVRQIAALDLEDEMTDTERARIIRECLINYILPAFAGTDTLEKLRAVLNDPGPNPLKTPLIGFELEKLQ